LSVRPADAELSEVNVDSLRSEDWKLFNNEFATSLSCGSYTPAERETRIDSTP
jgi:hypothetical protein